MRKLDLLLTAGLLLLAAPVAGYSADIDIQDNDVFIRTLRANYSLRPPEEGRTSLGLDMEISKARGDASQTLASGDYIQHGSATIYGPATAASSYNATFAMIGLREGWTGDRSDIDWIGGLDILHCDVRLRSGIRSPGERLYDLGFFLAGQVSFDPVERVRLRGKGIASTDFLEFGYRLLSGELAASIDLGKGLALFAGWRWLRFGYAREHKSDINIAISGLTAGMELAF